MTRRPSTATAVLHESKAVNFEHPTRLTNSMQREPLRMSSIWTSAIRPGSQDAFSLLSRTSFSDSPAQGELPAATPTLPQGERGSL